MVIIYGRRGRWKRGDIEFECKQLGRGAKFQCTASVWRGGKYIVTVEGGHNLGASDFHNSTGPPAVNNDHSLRV